MLHFLLILLVLVILWRLLGGARRFGNLTLDVGLKRLGFVLAILGAAVGGMGGYVTYDNDRSAHTLDGSVGAGIMIGFWGVWLAMWLLRWLIRGFTNGRPQ